jgi:hypothetical protein
MNATEVSSLAAHNKRHPSLHPLFEWEAHYMNSAWYWMNFSSAAMALRGKALKLENTTRVEEVERFDVWAMMAVRYGLRVIGLLVEFYERSAKDPMHAQLVMLVLENQNDTPATDDLDDVMKQLDMHAHGHPTDEACRAPTRQKYCEA